MKRTVNVRCGFDGCKEFAHYEAKNRKEASELYAKYGSGKYRCCRHTSIEEVLGLENMKRTKTMTALKSTKYTDLTELFWDESSGFTSGPGFKAYANDFPKGTKLIVTAEIILPIEKGQS